MRSGEVCKMLQISQVTLQHLRDSGQLPFTKLD
ncbi:helix-turn-helix domain-containing protein [Cnuella takakiae]